MNEIFKILSFKKKKIDIDTDIKEINKYLNEMDSEIDKFIKKVNIYMELNKVGINAIRNKVSGKSQVSWHFTAIRRGFENTKDYYPLRVQSFRKYSLAKNEYLPKLISYMQQQDDSFIKQFNYYEKERNSINQTITILTQMKKNLSDQYEYNFMNDLLAGIYV